MYFWTVFNCRRQCLGFSLVFGITFTTNTLDYYYSLSLSFSAVLFSHTCDAWTINAKENLIQTLHNRTSPSVRLMRSSYVISRNSWEVLDSYTKRLLWNGSTQTTQWDWPTDVLQVPIYNHSEYRGCHQLPLEFPCPLPIAGKTWSVTVQGAKANCLEKKQKSNLSVELFVSWNCVKNPTYFVWLHATLPF